MIHEVQREIHLLFLEGGWVMGGLLLLAFGIALTLLSIQRMLRFPEAEAPTGSSRSWRGLLDTGFRSEEERQAIAQLMSSPSHVEEWEHHLFRRVQRRFPFAFTLIGAAPLLGLMGTVSGMFTTFYGLSHSSAQTPVDVISGGISEALITTQTGLAIGIPSFIICSLLRLRADRMHQSFQRIILASRTPSVATSSPQIATSHA
ncbi:MAG: MotA/TolQ/ExbB proton channel family protein [Verrucomicrobiota bacterium]